MFALDQATSRHVRKGSYVVYVYNKLTVTLIGAGTMVFW